MSTESRSPWHTFENVTLSAKSLQELITTVGDKERSAIVAAPKDSRVEKYIPVENSRLPTGEKAISFLEEVEFKIGDLPTTGDGNKKYEYSDNEFDAAYLFLEPRTQFDRIHPFQDLTRIVKNGGTIVAVNGIKNGGRYKNASFWIGS